MLTEKNVFVATAFKVRPITCSPGDFNAEIALRERYRKNTRILDISDILIVIKGCVKSLGNVPTLVCSIRGYCEPGLQVAGQLAQHVYI